MRNLLRSRRGSVAFATVIALVPLIIWRLYRRFRKLVGRQRSKAWRHWTGAILFPFLILVLALPILRDTPVRLSLREPFP